MLIKKCNIIYLGAFLLLCIPFSKIAAQEKVGSPASKIHITDWIKGPQKGINLDGNFVVLDFWATWCAPCLAAVPHMNELQERFKKNKNLVFISISDENVYRIKKTLKNFHFDSYVVTDTSGTTQKLFGISRIPITYLIDDKGIIQWAGNPQNLTAELLFSFINGKNITVQEKSGSRKKQNNPKPVQSNKGVRLYDLYIRYNKVMKDSSLKHYFEIDTASSGNFSATNSKIVSDRFHKFHVGSNLKEILANILNSSPVQIVLPQELWDQPISYCFKFESKPGQESGREALLMRILNSFSLNLSVKEENRVAIILEVEDSSRLLKFRSAPNDRGSNISTSENIVGLRNNTLSTLVSVISKIYNKRVELIDVNQVMDKYDITFQHATFDELKESLSDYGIRVSEKNMLTKIYYLNY